MLSVNPNLLYYPCVKYHTICVLARPVNTVHVLWYRHRWTNKLFSSANRKSANSWAHSAIANSQFFYVCQSANRKSAKGHICGFTDRPPLDTEQSTRTRRQGLLHKYSHYRKHVLNEDLLSLFKTNFLQKIYALLHICEKCFRKVLLNNAVLPKKLVIQYLISTEISFLYTDL